MPARAQIPILILLTLVTLFSACTTRSDWNPFVDPALHDTVVVNDFASPDPKLGNDLANLVASELIRSGHFDTVTRSPGSDPALILDGRILSYSKGNVPLRIKTEGAAGHAQLKIALQYTEQPSGYEALSIRLSLDTRLFAPDASRTGRETFQWLQQEAARQIAQNLTSP